MDIVSAAAAALAGLLIGSFLNVCIYRIPAGLSVVTGRSHCTACGKAIRPYDLIPVLSFILLKGRCRNCGAPISPCYPLVELLNAGLYLALFCVYGLTPAFVVYALLVSALTVASFIDIEKKLIPDRINLFMICIGIPACFFSSDIPWLYRIFGFFAASLPLFIAMLASRGGMGFGDVKDRKSVVPPPVLWLAGSSLCFRCSPPAWPAPFSGLFISALQAKTGKLPFPSGLFWPLPLPCLCSPGRPSFPRTWGCFTGKLSEQPLLIFSTHRR